MKRFESYKKEILKKYEDERGGEISTYLIAPTTRNIKEACIYIYNKRGTEKSHGTLDRFFKFKKDQNPLRVIENFDLDKFRPIVNFLKKNTQSPSQESLELLSWLIDFQPRPFLNYSQKKNTPESIKAPESPQNTPPKTTQPKKPNDPKQNSKSPTKTRKITWTLLLKITISIAAVMISIYTLAYFATKKISPPIIDNPSKCMAWVTDHYEEVSCDKQLHPQSGTKIENYDIKIISNFEKVEVNPTTNFFSEETGLPLIWYYKKNSTELEYFTSPGVHPVNGKTLKEITPEIIEKYVPIHINNESSYVKTTSTPVTKENSLLNPSFINTKQNKEVGLFIFNGTTLDSNISKRLQQTIFKSYKSTTGLISPSKITEKIQESLITGNTSFFKGLEKHVDFICVGNATYSYDKTDRQPVRYSCHIQIDFEVFSSTGQQQSDQSFSKKFSGAGFSKEEAKTNAIKKIGL